MSDAEDLIEAVNAGDVEAVRARITADPGLAGARDPDGVSVIMLARYRSDREMTEAILAGDPELDAYEAAALGYIDRLRERLVEDPASATALSADGFTALHFAAFFGKAEAAKTLIDSGADVNATSRNPMRVQPLHSAAAGRHHEVCRILLAAGADINARQQDAYTPLHAAAQHGDSELVELFLSAGADPTARLDSGPTPSDSAEAAGHPDVANRLREVVAG